MEGAHNPTFRPTLTVWPAQPPALPPVVVHQLRRMPADGDAFTSWDPHPAPPTAIALPEDFCLRECLATDPDDLDAVFDLVSRWGRLTPLETHLRGPLHSLPASLDWLIPQLADTEARDAMGRIARDVASRAPDGSAPGHSLHAEAHHLRVLHALTGHAVRALADEPPLEAWTAAGFRGDDPAPWGTFVVTMNAALKPFSVHVRYPGADTLLDAPSTYEVAVLQLAQLLAEKRAIRACANQRCTRLFTRQRGRAKYDNTGHATGVLYCSAQCAKAQAERVRRARLRAEGQPDRPAPEG